MALFTPPEDLLINAMTSKQPRVRIEHCIGSLENVFKNALKKERRLLAFLASYEANYVKKGLIQLSYDYDVTIRYQQPCPNALTDVILDDGDWDATTLLTKGMPQQVTLVTSNVPEVERKLKEILPRMNSGYEGIFGWQSNYYSFDTLSTDTVCNITYSYLMPQGQLRQMQGKALFAAKNIWRNILGKSKVPAFVKPFLAYSYITQECVYDQRAYDEVESDPSRTPSDPVPHLSYGPLVEGRGICGGLAWAFKTLMDDANIECICVSGMLKNDSKVGHMWNMVKLDGQYYHVDPTWGIKDSGVHIQGLLQPDSMMRVTHIWDEDNYPKARGTRFDYDYIEDFLFNNGQDFIDDGANETYFYPDEIVD